MGTTLLLRNPRRRTRPAGGLHTVPRGPREKGHPSPPPDERRTAHRVTEWQLLCTGPCREAGIAVLP